MQTARCLLITAGLGLSLCGAQTQAQSAAADKPAPPASPTAQAAPPSASGGLLAQLGRELSALLLQNRDGVVGIRGWRALSPEELSGASASELGGFPGRPSLPTPDPLALLTGYTFVLGSGFLVQGDIVVTTAEVGEDIINPVVFPANGKPLRVLARSLDKKNNIALFKVAISEAADSATTGANALHPLRLGDSDTIAPGMLAVTVGEQAGFSTSGGLAFISQTGRQARSGARFYGSLIQFQGAVGPGSSGSPLLGPTGEVIGVVLAAPDLSLGGFRGGPGRGGNSGGGRGLRSGDPGKGDKNGHASGFRRNKGGPDNGGTPAQAAIAFQQPGRENSGAAGRGQNRQSGQGGMVNPAGGLSNIGFALPINVVKARMDELLRASQPVLAPGWVGFSLEVGPKEGAYVRNLYIGSPADAIGLEIGDIITQLDGHAIHSERDVFFFLRTAMEGQVVRLQILRGNATRSLTVRLIARPDEDAVRRMTQRLQPKVG